MKLIRYFIGYTAGMLVLLAAAFWLTDHISDAGGEADDARDMVYYNEQFRLIIDELEQGAAPEELTKKYGCEILPVQDEMYEADLMDAVKNEALILDYREGDILKGKLIWNDRALHYEKLERTLKACVTVIFLVVLISGYVLLGILYIKIIRPFHRLEYFSNQVAKGNLDLPLSMEKGNYFGAYTESFDLMREELKRAKESEYQANQSKKELIAQLSHDIKTPIATILATCEVLQCRLTEPDILQKLEVIDRKAKVIHELVDNLFHATLEELSILKVEPVEESSLCIDELLKQACYCGELMLEGEVPECLVYLDKLRFSQVLDNCLNNAWKYAGTAVHITVKEEQTGLRIEIRDEGNGVPEEELSLVTEKYFRGSNAKGKSGSGLGLYLSSMFMEKMQGVMEYYNENGFVVVLHIRKVMPA